MTRPVEDWADLKYREHALISHVFPFGEPYSLCGMSSLDHDYLGTGSFDEIEHAASLLPCGTCIANSVPTIPSKDLQ